MVLNVHAQLSSGAKGLISDVNHHILHYIVKEAKFGQNCTFVHAPDPSLLIVLMSKMIILFFFLRNTKTSLG